MSAILTVQEVAQRMRCEHRTVRRAIRSGELEAAFIGGQVARPGGGRRRLVPVSLRLTEPVLESPARPHSACRLQKSRRHRERRTTAGDGGERRMSVRKRGKQFEVRWTEGGRKLSRSFLRADDARAFDIDIKRRKQLGALAAGHHPVAQDARRVRGGGVVAALRDP